MSGNPIHIEARSWTASRFSRLASFALGGAGGNGRDAQAAAS